MEEVEPKTSKRMRFVFASRKTTKFRNISKEQDIRRYRAALCESIDIIRCIVCKNEIKSFEMMECRHSFCPQCFKNRLKISHQKDGNTTCPVCNIATINVDKKEKNASRSTVSFAPLSPKMRNERCRNCGETYEDKCKHCKRKYCNVCWKKHVDDLKKELNDISGNLEKSSARFENKISNFQSKANEIKDFINRDIETQITELYKKKENRIKKLEHIIAIGEASVEDIRQRMYKSQIEIRNQKDVLYDTLPDNEKKVKAFLDLQQRAAEVMATVVIWESALNDVEIKLEKLKKPGKLLVKKSTDSSYKRKIFTSKIIVNRNTVRRPSALAIDSWRDNIITTCPGSGQVVILDRKFKLVRRICHQEMMAPQGIAFLQEHDEIYVTDKWKHCIFVFNHKGEFVRRMCNKGYKESELHSPEGIAFHPEQSLLYVADTGNNRIQILKKDGTYLDSIGPKSTYTNDTIRFCTINQFTSQLNQPTDVAVTITCIAVADSGNHQIKVFDHDGQILRTIGGIGTAKGLFRSPEVLTIDKKGYIIVGDAGNGRVQIFSPQGEFLRVLGAKKTKGYKFAWISGILVTNKYNILISDSKDSLIYLF